LLSPALRRFLPYVRPYMRYIVVTIVTGLVAVGAATTIPLVFKAMIDGPITQGHPERLWPLAALLLTLALVEAGCNFGRRNYSMLAALGMETDLRNDFYAHLQSLQVGFHDSWQSGQLLSRAITDIQTIRRFTSFGMIFAAVLGVQWAVVMVMLLRLDWMLALLAVVVVLPLTLVSRYFFRRYSSIARRVQDQQGDMTTVIEEMATGVRIIKAFGRSPLLLGRFVEQAKALRSHNLDAIALRARTWTQFTLLPTLTIGVILLVGGLAVSRGQLTIGGLIAFMTYLLMLIWPLDAFGWTLAMSEEATTASTRLAEVFDADREIADRPHAVDLTANGRPAVQGAIRFEQVGFRYGDGPWVLRGLDLEIEPGETVALVGATGSGKTSVLTLVPRLYDVAEGRVTLDGTDVRDITLRSLRGVIGVAFEDPILFSASVYENLAMGRPGVTEAQVRHALQVAQADFVWDLPWGLETRIGEQGWSLSGGQRQRLALARAVLRAPRVLVLDDPLSAVDVHTEREIESALSSVLSGVTAVLVAHRPSTLRLADRVALLDGGKVTVVGTHSELLRRSARYRSLLTSMEQHGDSGPEAAAS
jgi:ATP-binding cassette, subfamily B, bacterial